jgi:uncharacterized pyridoxamine 5'-phosphate oxidase family protein
MRQVIELLDKNPSVFLATVDGEQPRVRPFQFQFAQDGRLWFVTARDKEVYAQMQNNPWVEFSNFAPDMTTLRVQGRAVLEDSLDIKRRVLELRPMIKGIYGSAENPLLVSFYVQPSRAAIFDFSGQPPRVFSF